MPTIHNIIRRMSEAVPLSGPLVAAAGGAVLATTTPAVGLVPTLLTDMGNLGLIAPSMTLPAMIGPPLVGTALGAFLAARYALLRTKRPRKAFDGLRLGPAVITRRDLYTSVLTLGATGSGKTARVIFPALEDLFHTYNHEDQAIRSSDPFQKLGGLILEVKGHFFETSVYLAHEAGRNSATDIKVIRGCCWMAVAEFEDEQGRRFFLNAHPCSSGSEVSTLYRGIKLEGEEIDSQTIRDLANPELVARSKDLQRKAKALRDIVVDVRNKDVRPIGWRQSGDRWKRVRRTLKRNTPEFTGEEIEAPKSLRYSRSLRWDNGLHFNLLNPRLPSSESASRLAMLAKMSTGEGKDSGGNAFFYQAAEKQITFCIELQREIRPDVECTVVDVYNLTTQDSALDQALKALNDRITVRKAKITRLQADGNTEEAEQVQRTVQQIENIAKYFTEEWLPLKSKGGQTGSSINATISNLFGPFLRDRDLQDTFCRPTTFGFSECMQKGVIFCFVPGSAYESQSKTLGTCIKMEAQSVMLLRTAEGADTINTNRTILMLADECQQYIVGAGPASGDARFMNLSRESRVVNMMATQAESWVRSALGREESDVWLQSFGTRIWLQTTDPSTAENASKICGKQKKAKWNIVEPTQPSKFATKDSASARRTWEEEERFKMHDFIHLPEDEAVVFNKGEGMADNKAVKGRVPFRWITSPDAKGPIADRMRWWFVEVWENQIEAEGRGSLLDPIPAGKGKVQAPPGVGTAPSASAAAAQPPPEAPQPAVADQTPAPKAPKEPAPSAPPVPSSAPPPPPAAASALPPPPPPAPAPSESRPSPPRSMGTIDWNAKPSTTPVRTPAVQPVAIGPANATPQAPAVQVAPANRPDGTATPTITPRDVQRQAEAYRRLQRSDAFRVRSQQLDPPAVQAKGPPETLGRLSAQPEAPPAPATENRTTLDIRIATAVDGRDKPPPKDQPPASGTGDAVQGSW